MCQRISSFAPWKPWLSPQTSLYRSSLEAQWATFFQRWGVRFRYNPEGLVTGEWDDLPDFFLPDANIWIEIRPAAHRDDSESIREFYSPFVMETRQTLVVLFGTPKIRIPEHQGWALACRGPNKLKRFPVHLLQCSGCGGFGAASFGTPEARAKKREAFHAMIKLATSPRLLEAYEAAQLQRVWLQ